jgi:hypothetical protein
MWVRCCVIGIVCAIEIVRGRGLRNQPRHKHANQILTGIWIGFVSEEFFSKEFFSEEFFSEEFFGPWHPPQSSQLAQFLFHNE